MESRNVIHNPLFCLLMIFCLFIAIHTTGCSRESQEDQAKGILENYCIKGGFIVHLNCRDGTPPEALKKN